MHTHENVLSNIETVFRVVDVPRDIGRELRTLVVVPLFHVTGCHSQTLPVLRAGGAAVIDASFDGRRMIETIERERITACTAVPAIYYHILNRPDFAPGHVACVRWASYGGAPIAPALVRKIAEQFAWRTGRQRLRADRVDVDRDLAAARVGGRSTPTRSASPRRTPRSPSVTPIRRLASARSSSAARASAPATGTSRTPPRRHSPSTGCTRAMWAGSARQGLVYVLDRIKDMINRGGENVYCVEVENDLIGAPGVGEVAVVGVPDPMMGEKVGAVIVPLPGAVVDPAAVVAYAREHLADFKVPQFVVIRAEPLPRNPNGKVLKAPLRKTAFGPPLF